MLCELQSVPTPTFSSQYLLAALVQCTFKNQLFRFFSFSSSSSSALHIQMSNYHACVLLNQFNLAILLWSTTYNLLCNAPI